MRQKIELLIAIALLITFCGCNVNNTNNLSMSSVDSTANESTVATQSSSSNNSIFDTDSTDFIHNSHDFPLYAKLESEDIYLYGVHPYGMILYQNGKGTYFDWPGLTPRQILPELSYCDYNGDGQKELAVTIYWGSGTGYSMVDLHILEITQLDSRKPIYIDHALLSSEVNTWFTKPITANQSDDKKAFTISFNNQDYIINFDNTDNSKSGNFTGISYGDIVEFKFDQSAIKVNIEIGLKFENYATYDYIGTVEAAVSFNDNHFSLSDYAFTVDDLYK